MNIEAIRLELDLKPIAFAKALGVSNGYAGDLRKGRRQPTVRVVAKLEQLTKRPMVKEFVKQLYTDAA